MRSLIHASLVMLVFLVGLLLGRYVFPITPSASDITQKTSLGRSPVANTLGPPPKGLRVYEALPRNSRSPAPGRVVTSDIHSNRTKDSIPDHLEEESMPVEAEPPAPPTLADEIKRKELRSEVAASLRQQGLPEVEVQRTVDEMFPPPPTLEEQYSPYELSPSEKPPEQLRAEIEASLKAAGLPPEMIQNEVEALVGVLSNQQPVTEEEPHPSEEQPPQ